MIKGLASNKRWTSDREMQRLRSLAGVFQRTNRILTGDRAITVKLANNNNARRIVMENVPGWSSYPEIYINYGMFNGFHESKTLVQLLGLNYHELSHLMFSPRQFKNILPKQYHMAYNVLEDQRIESLFTAMYQPAGKYFTEMVVKFIIAQESAWPTAFLWTHGRSFLPLEIRKEFEARFVLSKIMRTKAKRLINEYKTFTRSDFVNRYEEVLEVIKKFATIMNKAVSNNNGDRPNEGCGHPDPENGTGVDERIEKEAAREDERRREEEEETGEDQSGFWEDEDEEDGEEGEDGAASDDDAGEDRGGEDSDDEGEGDSGDEEDSGSGGGEDSEDEEGDGSQDGSGDEGEDGDDDEVSGDEAGEGDSSSQDGDGDDDNGDGEVGDDHEQEGGESGSSSATSDAEWDDEDLAEYLEEIIEAVNEDDDVKREVQNITTAMNDLSNIDVIDFDGVGHQNLPVSASVNMALTKVTQHFRKLYAEVEPGWHYGSDVGRLNVGRYMNDPDNFDEAFDEWDEGREHESGLEVVISTDISGSMAGLMPAASTALWMIKRACDEVGANTTVLGFHASTKGLYDRKERAPMDHIPVWTELGGATYPVQSMHLARRILTQSDLPNKLFVIITDGGWSGANLEGEAIRSYIGDQGWDEIIDSIPGTRMYVGLGGGRYNESQQKHFHVAKDLGSDPLGVVPLVEAAITQMLTERRR